MSDSDYRADSSAGTESDRVSMRDAGGPVTMDLVLRIVANAVGGLEGKVSGLESKMQGEIAQVLATVREAEAQRSIDYNRLATNLESVPSRGTVWKAAGATVLGMIAFLALIWAVFDTGLSIAGVFADEVLEQKQQQDQIQNKLDQLLVEDRRNDNTEGSQVQRNAR